MSSVATAGPGAHGFDQLIDGARLRADLTAAARAAAGDSAAQRRAALDLLKGALLQGREEARRRLETGVRGREIARRSSGLADAVIGALFDFTTVHVIRARNPTKSERIAMLAVGGYGRGALAPFSDVDLLFLRPYKETAHGESVIEYILYALWDLGLKVGHASRTVSGSLRMAREDMTVRTSLLEARPLAGDPVLANELRRRFRAEVAKGTAREFIAAKLAERDERHLRAGASRFLVEPNIKEGKGALRDLHTLVWIARYLRPEAAGDPLREGAAFDPAELRRAGRAFDFLEATRAHLHFAAGRAEERLTFGLQPEIARRMGYHDRGRDPDDMTLAVERYMRRYFLIAADVGRLTRVFAAHLEAGRLKARPRGLSRLLPRRRRPAPFAERGFHIESSRLSIDGPGVFAEDPVNLLRLFQIAGERDIDPHPDALAAASRALRQVDGALRADPGAARCFLAILTRGRDPARVLSLMNETGVLGRYLPEFGGIVGRTQFNMYHAYTIDEHSLRAVGEVGRLLAGDLPEASAEIVRAVQGVEDREALLLAMLLHDTGKGGAGGQETAGAAAARRACERLGLAADRVDLIAWLVGHHLLMSDVAQKRDINDPSTLASFARAVATPERLRLLLGVTVADICAVGPGVWNGWKARLLRDLFLATDERLAGGRSAEAESAARRRPASIARAARAALAAEHGRAAARWAASLEDGYFSQFASADQRAHFALAQRAEAEGAAVSVRTRNDLGATEAVIAARDRRGLFADLAGAIATVGGDIAAARIFTRAAGRKARGQALDIFQVRDAAGRAFAADHPRLADQLRAALTQAAQAQSPPAVPAAPLVARVSAFAVPARVEVDTTLSAGATVVEASGADRRGLLSALAGACAEAGFSIQSAHADSLGERVVDAFYLVDENGGKVVDSARLQSLKTALLEVLSRPGRTR